MIMIQQIKSVLIKAECLNGKHHLGEFSENGRIILKMVLKKNMREWTGFMRLTVETNDGLL
jgi:hypothetical protein